MRKKNLFYITVLSVMLSATLAGSVSVSPVAACWALQANVWFTPTSYIIGDSFPELWRADICIAKWNWLTKYIDGDTILFEGTLAPESTKILENRTEAYFNGRSVVHILVSKFADLNFPPGLYDIEFTITGKIRIGFFRIPFEGTNTIALREPIPPTP